MFLPIFLIVLVNIKVSGEKIHANSYKVTSFPQVYHNLQNIFDDVYDSSSNIYIEEGSSFSLTIELQKESYINAVTIFADQDYDTLNDIQIGYMNAYGQHSIKYKCYSSTSGYICRFPCNTGNDTVSIVGKYVFWTIKRLSKSAWTRVNELSIQGSHVNYGDNVDNKVDVVSYRPFAIQDVLADKDGFCEIPYWNLLDNSSAKHAYGPSQNMTIYFGRYIILKELKITVSFDNSRILSFHFGPSNLPAVEVNVTQDCYEEEDYEGLRRYLCKISSLKNAHVDRVSFLTGNVSKLKVYGIPVHYPSLSLSTSEVVGVDERSELEFTCTSATCAGFCEPPGEIAPCRGLMLFRSPLNGGPAIPVARGGRLEPLWAGVLGDLRVIEDTESKMVVRIPRTHAFVGQYQCGCEIPDAAETPVLSAATTFQQNEFLTEAIFQRNYAVDYRKRKQNLRDGSSGVIELATEGEGGFFHMTARGFTFANNLSSQIEWNEDGERREHNVVYSQEDVVRLYPDVDALSEWTVSANRVVARDIYPDASDDKVVIYQWGLNSPPDSSVVIDTFRIVDVDKKDFTPLRAWMVAKSDSLLHLLVYYQHSNSRGPVAEDKVEVELLRQECGLNATPTRIAAFAFMGKNMTVKELPEHSDSEAMDYGLAVNVVVKEYSTFSRYELRSIEDGRRTTLLEVAPSGVSRLKEELMDAKFNVVMTKFFTTPTSDEIHLEIQIELLSSVLLDQLNCTEGSLELIPKWDTVNRQKSSLQREPTLFEFWAPKSLKRLDFTGILVVGTNSRTTEVQIPSPYYERIVIKFDNATGTVSWNFVSPELRPAVKEYTVVVSLEDIGCGMKENLTLNYLAALNCTTRGGCSTNLWDVEQLLNKRDILMNYSLTIIPKYSSFEASNPTFGTPSQLTFIHGSRGRSVISTTAESSSPRSQVVSLLPSRKGLCDNAKNEELDATFMLTAYAILTHGKAEMPIEGVEYKKISPSIYGIGGTYNVSNLQPGREYKVKAFLNYPGPLSDLESSEVTFTTPDEIFVPERYISKDVGDSLLVNCSAAVGTDSKFQKDVRWLRADGGSLPEGTFSLTADSPDASGILTASLSIPTVAESHAGVYCCTPEPPVEHFYGKPPRCSEFRLVTNSGRVRDDGRLLADLELSRYELEANPGMTVAVTCSTKGRGELRWRGPDGDLVMEQTLALNDTGGVQSLRLLLREVNADSVGNYQCWFHPTEGETPVSKNFTLSLRNSLSVEQREKPPEALRFGDIVTLTCVAEATGGAVPRLRWFRYRPADAAEAETEAVLEAVATTVDGQYEVVEATDAPGQAILRARLTPATQGRYVCVAFPEESSRLAPEEALSEATLLQHAFQYIPAEIRYRSLVEIANPVKVGDNGEVLLRCTGFPALPGESLTWAFEDSSSDAVYDLGADAQNAFAPADAERIAHILSCFQTTTDKIFATWPSAETSNTQSEARELYSPDEVAIRVLEGFSKDPVCERAVGQLMCRYRGPRTDSSPFAALPEFGTRLADAHSSGLPAEATISLHRIRDAIDGDAVQKSASHQGTVTDAAHRFQVATGTLLWTISAAFNLFV